MTTERKRSRQKSMTIEGEVPSLKSMKKTFTYHFIYMNNRFFKGKHDDDDDE